MKIVHILCLIIFSVVYSSCNKYLDKKPDATQSIPVTIRDLQALLDYVNTMNFATPNYGEASADNYFFTPEILNSYSDIDKNTYIWSPFFTPGSNSDWAYPYQAIYTCNLSIEQLKKIPRTSSNAKNWDNVMGTALFFRSYYFLQLAWVYAKAYDENTAASELGIIMRFASDFNVPSKRFNLEDSYKQILADVYQSVDLLPSMPEIRTRPAQVTSYALLARTYLSMRKYDSCLKYSTLSLGKYNILLDYNDENYVNQTSDVPFKRLNPEIIFWTQMTSRIFVATDPNSSVVDTLLYNQYEDNDLRKSTFFASNGRFHIFKGSYSGMEITNIFSGITTAEVYLMRAECYARNGETEKALSDLNAVMRKRWINTAPFEEITASSAQEALQKILIERRKELIFRGLRWMDIKRLNMDGENITITRKINETIYTLPPNDKRYALPLPADIVEMTGVEQN